MAYPDIKLGSSFDAKGFKQAETATQKLEKGVKKLAGAFGLAFSARAVVNFSKAAVQAFAEDDAAITVLRQNLKNLGLAYQSQNAENFISSLEQQTGILDDELRPAYSKLSKVTLSTTKTQELMALAVDVARANGLAFSDVINTLSRAYVGNYKGLKQLNTGLTDAQLATKSFAEIQEILIKQSQGAGKAYIDTFAGSIDKLAVASANAKEVIGEGLIDLFSDLAGNGDINQATANVDLFATAVSDLLKDVDKLTALDYLGVFLTGSITQESYDKLKKRPAARRFYTGGSGVSTDLLQARKAAAAEAARVKAEKAAAAARAAAAKLAAKKDLALKKAAAVFDISKIQIAAALKATYDKDERLRLLAMQEIENDNGEAALKYIDQLKLLTQEQQTNKLAGITAISESELSSINNLLLAELKRISTTEMTEAEAAAARQEAYAKYNAAIIASGGLAEANFYTEKTQAKLLEISKLAGIDTVAAAQASYDILNYTTQKTIIERIAAAQKIADDAKYKALQDYLALLAAPIQMPVVEPPSGGGGSQGPKFGIGGQPIWEDGMGGPGYGTGQGTGIGSVDNSVTVVIEGNVLDGDDFTEKVNTALLNAQRTGLSKYPAGFLID
jgi:hypothetical protein